jgi:tetratricopeptide (TPR) repeat protein
MGQVVADLGELEAARSHLAASVDRYQELSRAVEDRVEYRQRLAIARSHHAQLLHALSESDAANREFTAATAGLQALAEESSNVPAYRNELAHVYFEHGLTQHERGEASDASRSFANAQLCWKQVTDSSTVPEYLNSYAWFLVTCPIHDIRDPSLAAKLARQARRLAPENPTYCRTLALAHLRAGEHVKGLSLLDEAVQLAKEEDAYDFFFRALAQHALGDDQEAVESYQAGVRCKEQNAPADRALGRIEFEVQDRLQGVVPGEP